MMRARTGTLNLAKTDQLALGLDTSDPVGGVENLSASFRQLYYHLYSNSNASRAERIVDDLSLLLLLKLAADERPGNCILEHYLSGKQTADKLLVPFLREHFPELIRPRHHFHLGDSEVRVALEVLREVNLSKAPAHVLGEAFQALIGPQLRGEKGQFFTPHSLVTSMVRIVDPQPGESVLDPACGTGGFLMEAHAYQIRQVLDESLMGTLLGVDKDTDLARLASTLLRVGTTGRAIVRNTNSLDKRNWKLSQEQFDVVLTNPPFGSRIGIKDEKMLAQYSFGHQWTRNEKGEWLETEGLMVSQDPQVLFLELCISMLKPGGRMGIVLPEGLFGNRSQAYIWEWVRAQGRICALLDCPRTTFQPGTDTKTNVLFFEKLATKTRMGKSKSTRIGVALNCGHDRRGRTHFPDGTPYPDDLMRLASEYSWRGKVKGGWTEIELGKHEYIVPRYFVKEMPISEEERVLIHGAPISTLGELVERGVIIIKKGHEIGGTAYGTGNVPFVRTSDLTNFEIRTDPTRCVSEEIYEEFQKQQNLKPFDILMVVDGRYRIGTTAIITRNNFRCVVQSHVRIISVVKPDVIDPYELLFALNLPSVKLRIRDLVFVQSTLGTLGKRLFELEIPILREPGPWTARLKEFRNVLEQRDMLLSALGSMGRDCEL